MCGSAGHTVIRNGQVVDLTIFLAVCVWSAIFRVPVIMYIKPTAIKIKVAPIVPMIRYL